MRAQGNGTPEVCANNLLRIVRGEVPYERVKGLDPQIIDRPIGQAMAEIQQDAEWLISTYEPRASITAINVEQDAGVLGGFSVTADIVEMEV